MGEGAVMVPKRSIHSKSRGVSMIARARIAPVLAISVAGVAVLDGAMFHPVPRRALRPWASTATTLLSRPWRLITSVWVTSGPRMTYGAVVILLVVGCLAEARVGWRTVALAGTAGTILATVVCDVALLAAAAAGSATAWIAAREPDFGVSAVTAGMAGALATTLPVWGAAITALVMLNGLLLHHGLADWEHLVAFAVGFGLTRREPAWARS